MVGWVNGEWSKEEDWVSSINQMSFSTPVLPVQSKCPKLTKFKGILHKHLFQMPWCFLSHIPFLAEDNSESKTGKVIKIKLDLLFICAQYRYISYVPGLWSSLQWVCTYPLYKEAAQKTLATQHMLFSHSIAWWGYGYRTCGRTKGAQDTGTRSSVFSQWKKRTGSSVHAFSCYMLLYSVRLILSNKFWYGAITSDYTGNTADTIKIKIR